VQVVLYGNDPAEVSRLTEGVARAGRRAVDEERAAACTIAFGDCSEAPVLDGDALAELAAACSAESVAAPEYRFFGDNLYHSGGINELARGATDEWLLVLNPECYAAPDLLVELLDAVDDPRVAAVEARQIPLEHPKYYDPYTFATSWTSGACLLVRRAAYEAVQGFDADHFPMYCNDVDLSWRLRLAGHALRFAPSAAVFHDKRVDPHTGYPEPTPLEEYFGLLAGLMLTTRFDRVDLRSQTIAAVRAGGSAQQCRAVEDFVERLRAGSVPDALPHAASVADFVNGDYGRRRF
jgi:hypothetical protein